MKENIAAKKILFQIKNRGYKESNLILSVVTEESLNAMSSQNLNELIALLEEDETILYEWLISKESLPKKYDSIFNLLRSNPKR